jgi:hypothetical protein
MLSHDAPDNVRAERARPSQPHALRSLHRECVLRPLADDPPLPPRSRAMTLTMNSPDELDVSTSMSSRIRPQPSRLPFGLLRSARSARSRTLRLSRSSFATARASASPASIRRIEAQRPGHFSCSCRYSRPRRRSRRSSAAPLRQRAPHVALRAPRRSRPDRWARRVSAHDEIGTSPMLADESNTSPKLPSPQRVGVWSCRTACARPHLHRGRRPGRLSVSNSFPNSGQASQILTRHLPQVTR